MLPMGASANLSIYQFVLHSNGCPVLSRLVPHVSLGLFDYKEEHNSLAFNHVFNNQSNEMVQ